jgi:hypothetical protein
MSMKQTGGPYSMSPVKNPHGALQPSPILFEWWYGIAASLWPPTTYKACQTPFICIKWIWYEYEVDGRSQSYPTACPQWEPHWKSYDWPSVPPPFRVMVWYDVVAIWLPAMVEGFQTLSICMRWIWYEYEVDPSHNFVMVVWFVPS